MTRTAAVVSVGGLSVVCLLSGALVAGQVKPEGTPPLQKYHIRPDDIPRPTRAIANPPMVVDKPAGASLNLPPGFKIDVFADEGSSGRSATSSKGRTVTSSRPIRPRTQSRFCATRITTARPTSDIYLPRA